MMWAPLVLAFWAGPSGGGPETSALVARLGSDRYSEREAAAEALEGLGNEAVEALRAARSDPDAEVRGRVGVLLDRIESSRLLLPTIVRLDPEPLEAAVDRIADELDWPLTLRADRTAAGEVIAGEPTPLTFWKAMDRLGLSALWMTGSPRPPFGEGRPATLRLFRPDAGSGRRHSDHGPFRVDLYGLSGAGPREWLLALNVLCEPGRLVRSDGPIRITEAIDEVGRSLVLPLRERPPEDQRFRPTPATIGNPASNHFTSSTGLRRAESPSLRLARLRGTVPVIVSARKDEPTLIPIRPFEKAIGRSFMTDEHSYMILAVREEAGGGSLSIELSVTPLDGSAVPLPFRGRRGWRGGEFRPFDAGQLLDQLALIDASGRPLDLPVNSRTLYDIGGVRLVVTFDLSDTTSPPDRLQFRDSIRLATEVPFAFEGVPLP